MSTQQQSLLAGVKPLPSRSVRETCSHCKQKLPLVHKHNLCKGLVSALWKLYHAKRPAQLRDIGLLTSEFTNFQKLHWFNLTQSSDEGWDLTQRGFLFLANRVEVERQIFTRAGAVVERSAETIKVADVDPRWQTKLDYSREARRA